MAGYNRFTTMSIKKVDITNWVGGKACRARDGIKPVFASRVPVALNIVHSFNDPDFFLDRGKETVLIIIMFSNTIDMMIYLRETQVNTVCNICSVWRSPDESTSVAVA
jgi:hypothetical protein